MLKVYITDLAAYNSGYLIGKWITMPVDKEELSCEIQQILSDGATACRYEDNHEEWFITDYEWEDISLFEVDEYSNVNQLNQQLQLLEHLSQYQLKAAKFLLDEQIVNDIEAAILKADDVTIYENQTLEDVTYDLIQECYNIDDIPSIIANHIDYNGIARDLEMDGTYHVIDDDVVEYVGQ